ncbi:unnamed protein product [Spirodela intermedia]|uniref:Uncharacterized protein n=1 Tax=Spirodela intermedia TaxID=51605 RepID=A0A7I8KJ07_SPIIN|nr:unnamed protein product [Spirodela intermedia]
MRQRCTGILSIWKDHHAMSMASKALLGQGRCGLTSLLASSTLGTHALLASSSTP